jgi:hypothetical protein
MHSEISVERALRSALDSENACVSVGLCLLSGFLANPLVAMAEGKR